MNNHNHPLHLLHHEHLPASFLITLLEQQRFGVEYQPIVKLGSQETFAYECLARFYDEENKTVRPDLVYASLHDSPLSLFQVEYQQKQIQLANAPVTDMLFVNLDQDSYFSCGESGESNYFLRLFNQYKTEHLTVELIENSEINDAIMSLAMIDKLSKSGIATAIDDVCNPQSMISTSVLQLVNYIKLDRHVVLNKHNENFMQLVHMLVNYAHVSGKEVILEGIETQDDLLFANKLGVDYVQGFLYRDRFEYMV